MNEIIYDPKTGIFFKKGKVFGSLHSGGYLHFRFNGKNELAHRVAWFFVHGSWPEGWIDHINGDKKDNRIDNLRLATPSQNRMNSAPIKAGKQKGVYKKGNKFRSCIRVDKKSVWSPCFETEEEARLWYETNAKKQYGIFYKEHNLEKEYG